MKSREKTSKPQMDMKKKHLNCSQMLPYPHPRDNSNTENQYAHGGFAQASYKQPRFKVDVESKWKLCYVSPQG
jgi:hypothetical protein